MTAINTAPASRDLTMHGHVSNRAAERRFIQNARIDYLNNGGLVAVYSPGSSAYQPAKVYSVEGLVKVTRPAWVFAAAIAQREAAKAEARQRLHNERLERAAVLAVLSMESDDAPLSA